MRKTKNIFRDKNRRIKFLENRLEVKDKFLAKQKEIIDNQSDEIDSVTAKINNYRLTLQDAKDDYENEKKITQYYRSECHNYSKIVSDKNKENKVLKLNLKIASIAALVCSSIILSISLYGLVQELGLF